MTRAASGTSRAVARVSALVAILVGFSAASAASSTAEYQGNSVQFDGLGQIDGDLSALIIAFQTGGQNRAVFEFELAADQLSIESYEREWTRDPFGEVYVDDAPTSSSTKFTAASAYSTLNTDTVRLFASQLSGSDNSQVSITEKSATLETAALPFVGYNAFDESRDQRVNLQESTSITADSGTKTIVIDGDFRINLEEVLFEVISDGASTIFDARQSTHDDTGLTGTDRAAYLFAQDATLTVTFGSPTADFALYTSAATATFPEGATIEAYQGPDLPASISHELVNGDLIISDAVTLAGISPIDSNRIGFAFAGDLLTVDDAGSGLYGYVQTTSGGAALAWTIAAILVIGAGGSLPFWLNLRPTLGRVQRAMDRGRYEYAARRTKQIVAGKLTENTPRAATLRAVSLLRLGRPEQAAAFLESLTDSQRPESPTWSYLLASAHAWVGKTEEATQLLIDCLHEAPQYVKEVTANPLFDDCLRNPQIGQLTGRWTAV